MVGIATVPNDLIGRLCARCKIKTATMWETEGAVAYIHQMKTPVCELCITRAQLEFAKERANAIPELELKIAQLEGKK